MHIYTGSDGRLLPSVSHIVRETRPISEVIRFQKVKQKKCLENGWTDADWEAYCDIGKNRGTLVHSYAEWMLPIASASPMNLDAKTQSVMRHWEGQNMVGDYVQQFNKFLNDLSLKTNGDWSLVAQEERVINDELSYGGRYDFRLKIGNQTHLFDIKTNKGYYSKWQNKLVCEWDLWRKPKRVPVLLEKEYKNGKSRMIAAKGEDGKILYEKEAMPDEKDRDWSWVSSYVEDYYLQLALYILAMRDEEKRGKSMPVDCANLLVLFPERYQLIRMPQSVWKGCKEEALRRVELFYKGHYQRWKLETQMVEVQEEQEREQLIVPPHLLKNENENHSSSSSEQVMVQVPLQEQIQSLEEAWSLPELPF